MASSRHILYRTMTNLIHPAVLGTVIVNLINLFISRRMSTGDIFPVLASAVLIWYFILDFWVTTTTFEDSPTDYRLGFFLLDILILIMLFGSFHALWIIRSDTYFFITAVLLILLLGTWNLLLGVFHRKDPFSQILVLSVILCAIPVATSLCGIFPRLHLVAKFTCLFFIGVILVWYTKFTLKE